MKFSKKQLKRIIKEEKKKLLNENGVGIGFANWEVNDESAIDRWDVKELKDEQYIKSAIRNCDYKCLL